MVGGFVAPGFEPVAEAFECNFDQRGELGASFAATLDDRPVVDLWGGVADRAGGRPWCEGTMQVIFSGTKGLTALCVAMLVEHGRLSLDEPIATYWPEFGAHGKDAITVAEAASHRARLPGIRAPLAADDPLDPRQMSARLAAQAPETDPRATCIYHPLTYGWLCGELVWRVDGRAIGRFFAEEVAAPLGLELWLGLPAEHEPRVAVLEYAPDWGKHPGSSPDAFPDDELFASIYRNPPFLGADWLPFNLPAWHAAEIAGAGAIGTARSIARLYGALARGGELGGVRIVSPETLERVCEPRATTTDPWSGETLTFGAGFMVQDEQRLLGPPEQAFGHGGAGGSLHGAWPRERAGFSYAMNEMRDDPDDERAASLLVALHACVVAA